MKPAVENWTPPGSRGHLRCKEGTPGWNGYRRSPRLSETVTSSVPVRHVEQRRQDVAPHAIATLRILAAGYVFYGWGMVAMNAFNSAGDTKTPTWITFWCFWVIELGLAWLLAFVLDVGPSGVFWAIPIGESFYAVLAMLLFRRGTWKTVQV